MSQNDFALEIIQQKQRSLDDGNFRDRLWQKVFFSCIALTAEANVSCEKSFPGHSF
jgi:hypothetical protein